MLLWNFVNLIDAEGGWIAMIIAALLAVYLTTRLVGKLFSRLAESCKLKEHLLKETFFTAIYKPLCAIIWVIVMLFCANLVTDHYLANYYPDVVRRCATVATVLSIAWFILRWKKLLVFGLLMKKPAGEKGKILGLDKLCSAGIVVLTLLTVMELTGQSISTLLAFGGISGLALAIASQELIANFFGGLMIFINRPFQEQEHITFPSAKIEGVVEEIGWYQTVIRASDHRPVYVPNSLFTKAYVINTSRACHKNFDEVLHLRHEDMSKLSQIIKEVTVLLKSDTKVDQEKKVLVHIDEFSPHSLDLKISVLSLLTQDKEFYPWRDKVLLEINKIIEKNGAKIETASITLQK